MKPRHQLANRRFLRLLVIGQAPSQKGRRRWFCICDCGTNITVTGQDLRSGHTKSCGCYKLELMRVSNLQHGMTKTKTHNIWNEILRRCLNPSSQAFKNYGGRGIRVCDRWLIFVNFLTDMGECPQGDYSIERIDVNGNYEPGNCIWLPRRQQLLNTRRNRRVTIAGETKPLILWCQQFNCRYKLVYDRITKLGWTPERALTDGSHV